MHGSPVLRWPLHVGKSFGFHCALLSYALHKVDVQKNPWPRSISTTAWRSWFEIGMCYRSTHLWGCLVRKVPNRQGCWAMIHLSKTCTGPVLLHLWWCNLMICIHNHGFHLEVWNAFCRRFNRESWQRLLRSMGLQSVETTISYVDSNNVRRFKGSKFLKKSQVYPNKFGRAVTLINSCRIYVSWYHDTCFVVSWTHAHLYTHLHSTGPTSWMRQGSPRVRCCISAVQLGSTSFRNRLCPWWLGRCQVTGIEFIYTAYWTVVSKAWRSGDLSLPAAHTETVPWVETPFDRVGTPKSFANLFETIL